MTNHEQLTHSEPPELSRRRFLQLAAGAGAALVAEGCSGPTTPEYGEAVAPDIQMEAHEIVQPENILSGTWQYMPGAKVTKDGLELTPLNRQIMDKRNGNKRSPNPPFNVFGSRLQVYGDFGAEGTLSGDPTATLDFYGDVPLRFDDMRIERSRVSCTTKGNELTVSVWDGSSQTPHVQKFPFEGLADKRAIGMECRGDAMIFAINGQQVGRLSGANHLFQKGQVWFGAYTERGTATLHDLTVAPLDGGTIAAADTSTLQVVKKLPDGGLQSKVKRPGFKLGTAVSPNFFADMLYTQINAGGEVASWTPENVFKPAETQPIEGVFNFAEIDGLAELAKRHGIELRGHALIYDKALPQWMEDLPTETAADKQRVSKVLADHVTAMVKHGKKLGIKVYDVVNEVIDGFGSSADARDGRITIKKDNVFYRALGDEYIDIAFRAARAADPKAKLYINDYGLETNPGRADVLFGLIDYLTIKHHTPIDGIGVQGHEYELPRDAIKPEALQDLAQRAQSRHLEIAVTELDVTGDDAADQADQYVSTFKTALGIQNCPDITTWGLCDSVGSTYTFKDGKFKPGNALMYGANDRPKKNTRDALVQALQG
ncbi:MAG TPA: endo-1,4-beta-xylanase [Candidatus Saccharimonadales bacterium]|nr:endo-1,4-beta-xylanase [Candidatus Saccharimonadales bacterium]